MSLKLCDYARAEAGTAIPENIVQFGVAYDAVTRLIREMVCTRCDS